MRILIYGAGVIGSLYAVLFAETGYDTSIYARGKRLEFLKKNGLLYKKNQNIRWAEATILGECYRMEGKYLRWYNVDLSETMKIGNSSLQKQVRYIRLQSLQWMIPI